MKWVVRNAVSTESKVKVPSLVGTVNRLEDSIKFEKPQGPVVRRRIPDMVLAVLYGASFSEHRDHDRSAHE